MIETILQHTETLQELLDRRVRLLKDLQHIDEGIRASYLIVMGDEPTNGAGRVSALPPSAARVNGTPRRGRPPGKTRRNQKALPAVPDKAPQVSKRGEAKKAVLGALKSQPKRKFKVAEVAEAVGCTKIQAGSALTYLKSLGSVKRTGRGVFQYKNP